MSIRNLQIYLKPHLCPMVVFISFLKEGRKSEKKNCSVQIDQFVGGCQGNGKAKKKRTEENLVNVY